MAQLAIASAGAIGSSLLGFGPAPGFVVGSIVGGFLFPSQETGNTSPQIGDRTVMTSAYGAVIPICYGTVRLAGNVIWAKEIETIPADELSGGKGGSRNDENGDELVAVGTFAVAFGEGSASALLKIWADGNLIYDAGAFVITNGLSFRFYEGTEEQTPDPAIKEDQGEERTPAFRGIAYLVLENLPLTQYGNRIPSISAEIAYSSEVGISTEVLEVLEGDVLTTDPIDSTEIALHWDLGMVQVMTGSIMRKIDLYSMNEVSQYNSGISTPDGPLSGSINSLDCYIDAGTTTTHRPIHRIKEPIGSVSFFGATGNDAETNFDDGFVNTVCSTVISGYTQGGGMSQWLLTLGSNGQVGALRNGVYIFGANLTIGQSGFIVSGVNSSIEFGFSAWILGHNLILYKIRVNIMYQYPSGAPPVEIPSASISQVYDFGYLGGTKAGIWFDHTDGGVIVASTNGAMAKFVNDEIAWTNTDSFSGTVFHGSHMNSLVSNARLVFIDNNIIYKLNTLNGLVSTIENSPYPYSNLNFQAYHGPTDTLIAYLNGTLVRLGINRLIGTDISVSSIIIDICERVGISNVDTSQMVGQLRGYIIGREGTAGQSLEPFFSIYGIEVIQSGNTLKFVRRGGGDFFGSISESQVLDTDDSFLESRLEIIDLPRSVEVIYIDYENDYQQGIQRTQRSLNPISSIPTGDKLEISVPIAINSNSARRASEELMYSRWHERLSLSFQLPRRFLRLEPTDICTFLASDGRVIPIRITKVTPMLSSGWSIAVDAVAHDSTVYDDGSGLPGDPGSGPSFPPIGSPATFLILENFPLLLDAHDVGRTASRIYFALSGLGQPWNGGKLFRSVDGGITQQNVGSATRECTHGFTETVLGGTNTPYSTDYVNSVRVRLRTGRMPVSISRLQLLNGANLAYIGGEIIQFQNVELLSDGSYLLSNLLRARRGTDYFVNIHDTGELFLLIDYASIRSFLAPLGQIGGEHIYRAVGNGQTIDEAIPELKLIDGNDLRPYSVACLKATDIDNAFNITWIRRTRVGGELVNFTGTVPLAEDEEKYELEMYTSPGMVLRKTVLNLLTNSYVYSYDEIIDDFGSLPSEFIIVVYQISAQVGRGWPKSIVVEI